MGICVVADQSSILVNLTILLSSPFDIDGVDGGWVSCKCLLMRDFVLVIEIKLEIAGDECCWFSVKVVEDGTFVGVRGVLTIFG